MNNIKQEFEREALVLGEDAVIKLNNSSVALFGVGGVGSYAAEALARAGVGRIMLIDNDTVSRSNINRQLCALQSTIGQFKVDVVAERIRDINPDATVECRRDFVLPDNIHTFSLEDFDFVIDAIDTVSAKIAIIETTLDVGTPSVSCMGTGNKLDPTAFCVTDISKTNTCPLARVMRRELKKRGITHARVIYSTEEAITPKEALEDGSRRSVPGSLSFVPSVAGLIAASEAVKSILKGEKKNG